MAEIRHSAAVHPGIHAAHVFLLQRWEKGAGCLPFPFGGADHDKLSCDGADAGYPYERGTAAGKCADRPEEGKPARPLPGYAGGLWTAGAEDAWL